MKWFVTKFVVSAVLAAAAFGALAQSPALSNVAKLRTINTVLDPAYAGGARCDGTTNDAAAIQAAINAVIAAGGGELVFPAGRCVVNSRIKIQNTYTSNTFIKLRGAATANGAVAAASTYGTIIVGQTSGIIFDLAGGSNITIEDMALISGPTNPSTIGILGQRIVASPYFTRINLTRVSIGITPNTGANGGLGTFGIVNKRGEHHTYTDVWIYADRPYLADGSSVYPTLISPDFAENVFGGATLSINHFNNCVFLPASGDAVELRSTFNFSFNGGYVLLQNGKAGFLLGTSNKGVMIQNLSSELGAGTPLSLVRATGSVYGLTLKAGTNIAALTAIRTVGGATIQGADVELRDGFTAVFDKTTEAGGTMQAALIKYDSGLGHTVPDANSIYASIIMDGAGGVGAMDLRALNTPTAFNTGGLQPPTATTGTDTTPSTTETYIAEIFIPFTTILTGAVHLQGSAGAGNATIYLCNQSGTVVAQTASFSVAGVTAAYVGNNFTAAYQAKGPGKYYIAIQFNNVANRFRTHALGVFGASKKTTTVYGTLTSITAPSSFTADLGPIASVF